MSSLADAISRYRALREELGWPGAPGGLSSAPGATGIERLIEMLVVQPSGFPERRRAMIERIRHAWSASGAEIDLGRAEEVLAALAELPREQFVDPEIAVFAYLPTAIRIGYGQTLSHPLIAADLALAAEPGGGDVVLDVGTGSGYQAALLSKLARHVVSVEIIPALASSAADRLFRLGVRNVEVRCLDGGAGFPDGVPFDAIVVAAGAGMPPEPLLRQLRPGGRLVLPLGPTREQEQLVVVTRGADGSCTELTLGPAQFVPLTGAGSRSGSNNPPVKDRPYRYGAPITLDLDPPSM